MFSEGQHTCAPSNLGAAIVLLFAQRLCMYLTIVQDKDNLGIILYNTCFLGLSLNS